MIYIGERTKLNIYAILSSEIHGFVSAPNIMGHYTLLLMFWPALPLGERLSF